ncbi:MAG: hypothetical protein BGO70_08800 [Bacteroidetes bacterium 43-93]|nr:T9SS type A sorting domain-containing protein [Bacteroidota bacterium]OJX00267.1 MAG: hypothetical protein BGO70_08800 [Bacteroidetes bacterium 43-93]
MKYIFTVIVILSFLTSAKAKRYVDIQVTIASPTNNFAYVQGGNVPISLIIKNVGQDTLSINDSIAVRFIDNAGQAMTLKNGNSYTDHMGFKAKTLFTGDTMHIDTLITTTTLPIQNFLNGKICIDAYPCIDSINLWNTNMDTAVNNNAACININMIPTSVTSVNIEEQVVDIYPNPVTDRLNIKTNPPTAKISILNIYGAHMGQPTEVKSGQWSFDTGLLTPGLYFVQLVNDGKTRLLKFSKE